MNRIYLFLRSGLLLTGICAMLLTNCHAQEQAESEIFSEPVIEDNENSQADRIAISEDLYNSRTNAITRTVLHASPAIVGINVTQMRRVRQRSFFEDDPIWGYFYQPREYLQKVESLGSGFIISSEGYVLTNQHVVDHATEIIVTLTDGKQYQAEKVGEDAKYDIALLKIKGENLPYIELGDSEDIIIGEWVIALGNPFGLFDVNSKPTVTVGVISAIDLDFKEVEGHAYNDMIQTDAAINSGNSGGPLLNSQGVCIGINTFIISGSDYKGTSIGIGFAIPINRVKKILPDLKTEGQVDRSFQTGIAVENMDWLTARMLGLSRYDGVMVTRVDRNSSAEKAGVQVGDVIVAIDANRIRNTSDVQRAIQSVDVTDEKKLQLTLFRDGKLVKKVLHL